MRAILALALVLLARGVADAQSPVRIDAPSDRSTTASSAPRANAAQKPPRLVIRQEGERTLLIEAEFPALPASLDGEWSPAIPDGMQSASPAGVNLPAYIRELGIGAADVEIVTVESIEQTVAGVRLGTLDDAPITGDSALDRRLAAMLRPLAPTGLYPERWATIASAGTLNGRPISVLRLTPYRYDAARSLVATARRMTLRVRTKERIDRHATGSVASAFTARPARKATAALQAAVELPTTAPDGYEYKIFVDRDGVFRLMAQDLIDAGIPLDALDARTLKLWSDNVEQPLLVHDRGDNHLEVDALNPEFIEFFGARRRARGQEPGSDLYFDPHASNAVYFLTWGGAPGKRLVEESGVIQSERLDPAGDLTGRGASFVSTIHLEQDQVQSLFGNAELNTLSDRFDRNMWGVAEPNEMRTFEALIPTPDVLSRREVTVRAAIRSALRNSSESDTVGDSHVIEVFVDAFRAIEARVPTVGLAILDNVSDGAEPLTADKLRTDGRNLFAVVNRRAYKPDVLSDAHVNWFEITYPRLYVAANDSIEFSVPPGIGSRYATFRIRGFSSPDIRIYRRGVSRISNVTILAGGRSDENSLDTAFDVQFQAYVASPDEKFFATTERNIERPVLLRDRPAGLLASTNAADFIVIVDETTSQLERFDEPNHALRQFLDFKTATGFRPKLVRAADIYDEFNGGSVSPMAIKRFLAHAYHTWATPPRYALIFAKGSPTPVDDLVRFPKAHRGIMSERSYVPSIMLQTVLYGATECDYLLGCVDGIAPMQTNLYEGARTTVTDDLIAEVILGRVAVNDIEDIAAYVGKVIDQESARDGGEWRGRSLLIGGWEGVQGQQLQQLTTDYARHISEPYRFIASVDYIDTRYFYGAGRSIMALLNNGVGLVTYLGHGGGGQWEGSAELNIANARSVSNRGHMGTILSLTCFTGAYNVDGCLIGKLITSPNGGAIQALGTPGFGWLRNNGLFAEGIYAVMHNPRYRTLSFGEIITLGKALYIGTYLSGYEHHVPTVAAMYTIFGDPSLRPPYVDDTVAVVPSATATGAGAQIIASAALPFAATQASAHLFDTTEMPIPNSVTDARIVGDRVEITATVPSEYVQPFIGIRVFASDEQGGAVSGAVRIPTGSGTVSRVRPAAPLVAGNDAVFEIEHMGAGTLDEVRLSLRYEGSSVFTSVPHAVTNVGPRLYRTAPIPGAQITPAAIVDVELPATTTAGARIRTFHVEGGADPSAWAENAADTARELYAPRANFVLGHAVNESIGMEATPAGPRIAMLAYNWGDRDATDIPYRIEYDSAGARVAVASGSVSIPARGRASITADIGTRMPVARKVRLVLDPDQGDHWIDAYLRNNEAYRTVPISAGMLRNGVGFTLDGTNAAAFAVPSLFSIAADPASARGDGLVTAELDSAAPSSPQQWPLLAIGAADWTGSALRLRARGVDATTRIALTLSTATSPVPDDARIVGYDSTTHLWLAYPTTVNAATGTLTATVPPGGVYAIARVSDRSGPRIKFSVEGQFFLDSAAVPKDARFSAVLFDESGIDPERLRATLDGAPLEVGRDIVWLDSTITSSSGSVRMQKPVDGGAHQLCVTATDRVGNERTECTSFEVDGELAVRMYGNFPNPFSSETFIAYEIRGASVVDEMELKIFSTAGKLVRTFRFPSASSPETRGLFSGGTGEPTAVGYHEAWWDGRDDSGREVANGVYFYRLRVRLEDREIEELGTLARIR